MRGAIALAALGCAACAPRMHAPVPVAARMSAAPAPILLPPMHEETLANGLAVLLIEHHELPIVQLTLEFPRGAETESPEKAGIGALAVELLRQGTRTRSADQIAEAIDFVGGSLSSSTGDDSMDLYASALRKDFSVTLDLLAEEVSAPAFPPEEVEDARKQLLASLKARFDDPETLATDHARSLAYGPDDPYSWFATEASVAAVTREDLIRYRAKWLIPEGATLVIAGDVDESILPAVRAAFGPWSGKAPPPLDHPRRAPKARVRLLDKPDLTQSFIAVVLPGIDRHAPDYDAAQLADAVFGDGFSTRLTKKIRTEKGKTYGISGAFEIRVREGIYLATTSTRTAETASTLSLLLEEIHALQTQARPITSAELAQAKASLIGSWPRRFETMGDITAQILGARRFGLPLQQVTGYRQRLAAVTLEEANAAAARHLLTTEAVIVVCGKASEVQGPLEALLPGPVEVVDFKAPVWRKGT